MAWLGAVPQTDLKEPFFFPPYSHNYAQISILADWLTGCLSITWWSWVLTGLDGIPIDQEHAIAEKEAFLFSSRAPLVEE